MSPLLNVLKFLGKLINFRKKHWRVQKQTFQQVPKFLKIFGNLWKSPEIFRKNWKMSQSAQDDLPAFQKILMKFLEIIESIWTSLEIFRKFQKSVAKCLK